MKPRIYFSNSECHLISIITELNQQIWIDKVPVGINHQKLGHNSFTFETILKYHEKFF